MSVEPPDFHHHRSLLGVAVCDTCRSVWPCHLSAWGGANRESRCQVAGCGGAVSWTAGP